MTFEVLETDLRPQDGYQVFLKVESETPLTTSPKLSLIGNSGVNVLDSTVTLAIKSEKSELNILMTFVLLSEGPTSSSLRVTEMRAGLMEVGGTGHPLGLDTQVPSIHLYPPPEQRHSLGSAVQTPDGQLIGRSGPHPLNGGQSSVEATHVIPSGHETSGLHGSSPSQVSVAPMHDPSGHLLGLETSQALIEGHSSAVVAQLESQQTTGVSSGQDTLEIQSRGLDLQLLSLHKKGRSAGHTIAKEEHSIIANTQTPEGQRLGAEGGQRLP